MLRPTPGTREVDDTLRLDEGWVRALFLDLYGRPPYAQERARWIGADRTELVDDALRSEEAWRHWLDEQLYYFMLIDTFRPVGTSLDELPALLARGAMAPRDALHRIALSTSFDLRNPGADTFVTVVMEQLCGMRVQKSTRELEIGKAAYDGNQGLFLGEKASSQSDVVAVAVRHVDAARHFVEREHERLLRAPIDRRDRSRSGKRVHRKPAEYVALLREWLLSDAYAARVSQGAPLSNRVWVRAIYVDLGGSLPTVDDTESLRSALDGLGDPAPLRSAIVRMLLDADATGAPRADEIDDAGEWVEGVFERLLGRAPSDEERAAFTETAEGASDGPELVLYALLTSEEYERP
ncbi:MAG: hypothetical protein AAGA20_12810 [Planctomycetota bacterium]